MNTAMNVKLPILYNTDSTSHLEKLEIDFKLSDCDVRDVNFHSISATAPYREFGKDYTVVYSCGFDYICPLSVTEVERLIHESKPTFYAN